MSRTATRKKEKWLLEWITEKLMKGGEFFSERNNDDGMWQKKCRFAGYLSSNQFEYNDQKKNQKEANLVALNALLEPQSEKKIVNLRKLVWQ